MSRDRTAELVACSADRTEFLAVEPLTSLIWSLLGPRGGFPTPTGTIRELFNRLLELTSSDKRLGMQEFHETL
jgi:hypothetical protein